MISINQTKRRNGRDSPVDVASTVVGWIKVVISSSVVI